MRKIMKRKIAVAAIAAVSCISIAGSALAFNNNYSYAIGPSDTKKIAEFTPGESTLYLNTRPTSGGGVTISLNDKTKSFTFPAAVSVPDWKVSVEPSVNLKVKGTAPSTGVAGILHIWSK